ncbi:hypothetical protein [Alloactinosynnema sp. L-07]|uniref:hypothetical protein n=1 Tax=Alloactinosynnema sp. L-07 TaxID=1653480 RepID=UPI00065EF095|nr:hypothetical protein [Alloactinosynnema sp. L-07]CRK56813.1 hypothetical protein [Alloactinosynnema sp. L-07]
MDWHPLFEAALEIDERDRDRGLEVVGDRDLAVMGRGNRIALALGPVVALGPSPDGALVGYDISLLCVLHPHAGCHFRSAKLVVDLTTTPGATVHDMSPREVRGASPVETTTKVGGGFTFDIVPTLLSGEVQREQTLRQTVHEPIVLTSGRGFSRAMWDFRATQDADLRPDRELRLLVTTPPGVPVLARFNLRAQVALGLSGGLLTLLRRTSEIEQTYRLAEPIPAVGR